MEDFKLREPRLALNDGCFGEEAEGTGSDGLEGLRVDILIDFRAEEKGEGSPKGAAPRGRLGGGGEELFVRGKD